MKPFLPIFFLLFVTSFVNAQNQNSKSNKADAAWLSNAQAAILKNEYFFKSMTSSFGCANRKQKVIYNINSNGYSVTPLNNKPDDGLNKSWQASFQLLDINKGTAGLKPATKPLYTTYEGSLIQSHPFFYIQYTNDEDGLRQNFIIAKKPEGSKNLVVRMQIENKDLHLELVNDNILKFKNDSGRTIIQYDGLKVWDANDKPLKAFMKLSEKKYS